MLKIIFVNTFENMIEMDNRKIWIIKFDFSSRKFVIEDVVGLFLVKILSVDDFVD